MNATDPPAADFAAGSEPLFDVAAEPVPQVATAAAPSVASHAATDDAPAALRAAPLAVPNPHYARIGGAAGVESLVDRFYVHMGALPAAGTIRAMHPGDLAPVKAVLTRFLTEWMGGPQVYSKVRGEPRLRRRHLPFAIGAPERDAWIACMQRALDDAVADPDLRDELAQAFRRTADFIRNDRGTTHDHYRHHPTGRP
jgi:hemoglobin